MEAELDTIEAEEAAWDDGEQEGESASDANADARVERKLREVQQLRDAGAVAGARKLLYEILSEGNVDQVNVARNILQQLDAD